MRYSGGYVGAPSPGAGVVISVALDRESAQLWCGGKTLVTLKYFEEAKETWAKVRPGAMFMYKTDYEGRLIHGTLELHRTSVDGTVPKPVKQAVMDELASDEWTLLVRRGNASAIRALPKLGNITPRGHMNLDGYDPLFQVAPWHHSGYLSAFEYRSDKEDDRTTLIKALETDDLFALPNLQLICVRGLAPKQTIKDLTDVASYQLPTEKLGLLRTEKVTKKLANHYSWIVQDEVLYFGEWLPTSFGLTLDYDELGKQWLSSLTKAMIIEAIHANGELLPHASNVYLGAKPRCSVCKKAIEHKTSVVAKKCKQCGFETTAHAQCQLSPWLCGSCDPKSFR
jgi:hypothetical protein